MKRHILNILVLAIALMFALVSAGKAFAQDVTVVGKVEQGKIVAEDGKEYMVADNAKGKELMKDHMGHKVEVKGKVTEKDGKKTIDISSIKHISA